MVRAAKFSTLTDQSDFFAQPPAGPAGFAYQDQVISIAQEHAMLKQFETLPFKPFEFRGVLANRRIVSFGWRYDYAGRTLRNSAPIPDFLMPLRQRAAEFAQIPAAGLQQVLINEYAPGAAIGWHIDNHMFEDVIGISFGAACTMRLRRLREAGWERLSFELAPRSAYLLRGPARREWQHSIPPGSRLRYSVTFRNFDEDETRYAEPMPAPMPG